MEQIDLTVSEEMSLENVDGRRTDDGRTPDACIYYKLFLGELRTFKIFARPGSPMIFNFGMHHYGLELYKVYINSDPGMTLTYFTARRHDFVQMTKLAAIPIHVNVKSVIEKQ